ncbi:MAG: hypothetical protein K1060chlam5_00305 [Candidatus Anoxychlamydiales bacterium]|nr:hypothetical protein [Candidatus Anoxychlamydiales bacterium]
MSDFYPKLESTIISDNNYEWKPASFKDLLIELEHIEKQINEAFLFRGHRRSDWLLESTFARSLKEQNKMAVTDLYPEELINDVIHQHQCAKHYLDKMDCILINPELQKSEKEQGIDSYFEFHRHHQQNPEDPKLSDIKPLGTCFIDFSYNWKVALFFANLNRNENEEGSLFMVRQKAIGKALQRNVLFKDVLHTLKDCLKNNSNKMYGQLPLLIYPEKQINNLLDSKPKRQEAIYFAQMDFRIDLELSWALLAQKTGKQVFVKLVLPKDSFEEIDKFLKEQGITQEYLFPSTIFDKSR